MVLEISAFPLHKVSGISVFIGTYKILLLVTRKTASDCTHRIIMIYKYKVVFLITFKILLVLLTFISCSVQNV